MEKEWLKQFKYKHEHSKSSLSKSYQELYVFGNSIAQLVSFRHRVPTLNSMIGVILYIVFVVLDLVFTLQILIPKNKNETIFTDLRMQLFLFVYPGASIISPLLGIIAMISCKSRLY
jgi:hypothetical protein